MKNTKELNYSKEVLNSLLLAKIIAKKQKSKTVTPLHLLVSLLSFSEILKKILKYPIINKKNILNIKYTSEPKFSKNILEILNIMNIKGYLIDTLSLFYFLIKIHPILIKHPIFYHFSPKNLQKIENLILNIKKDLIIPCSLNNILSIFLKRRNSKIIGRNKECLLCKQFLLEPINHNLILIGNIGVGKMSIIDKFTKNCYKKYFVKINLNYIIKDFNNISFILEKLYLFVNSNQNLVFICEDIDLLFNKDNKNLYVLTNFILWGLKEKIFKIIGTSSCLNISNMLNNELELLFYIIKIDELSKDYILRILSEYWFKKYKLNISINLLKEIIILTTKFINKPVLPKKGKFILDLLYAETSLITTKKLTKQNVLKVISKLSKLPKELINSELIDENKIKQLNLILNKRLTGQEIVIDKILISLKKAFLGLKDYNKPIGSWFLCGPSGTGKTELIKTLAEAIFGSESAFIRFDMSEFMEKHAISKLIGSPPGYVGFENGGLLTEQIKIKPFSIILFDEIEKAHKDINNIMLQILDEGILTDSKGQKVDFSNTMIFYTSNLGCSNIDKTETYKIFSKKINLAVKNYFKPEFLNRLNDIVIFKPLSLKNLSFILTKFISNFYTKLKISGFKLKIEIQSEAKLYLAKLAVNSLYGARPLKRLIENVIEKPILEILPIISKEKNYIFSVFIDKITDNLNFSIKKI